MQDLGYTIAAFFGAFVLGMAGAAQLQKHSVRLPVVIAGTPAVFVVYLFLLYALPFYSPFTEILLFLLAATAVSGPMYLMNHANLTKNHTPKMALLVFGYLFPFAGGSLFALLPRINCAVWYRWECEGRILEVTINKGNHGHPVLIVDDRGKTKYFEMVDSEVYGLAKPGMMLIKGAGSSTAWLDGKHVRMVPRQLPWWHEPK